MTKLTREKLEQLARDGRVECETDVNRFGRVEVRWTKTGKRETVTVVR